MNREGFLELIGDKKVNTGEDLSFAPEVIEKKECVYDIKDELQVTEDLILVPISVYNKTKIVAE